MGKPKEGIEKEEPKEGNVLAYPVPPVARVVAVGFAIEFVHHPSGFWKASLHEPKTVSPLGGNGSKTITFKRGSSSATCTKAS